MAFYLVDDSWVSILGAGCPLQVFSLIATYTQSKGECDLTIEQMAERTGYYPRHIKKAMKMLREKEMVEKVKNGVWMVSKRHLLEDIKGAKKTLKRCQNDTIITNKNTIITNNKREARAREENFVPPTLAEIIAFAKEAKVGSKDNASAFFDFYTSQGWRVGDNSMRDWQSSFRMWVRRESQFASQAPQKQTTNPTASEWQRYKAARQAEQPIVAEETITPQERERIIREMEAFQAVTFRNTPKMKH